MFPVTVMDMESERFGKRFFYINKSRASARDFVYSLRTPTRKIGVLKVISINFLSLESFGC